MRVAAQVLCLSGSLRRESSNSAALGAAYRLAPSTLELLLYQDLGSLPLLNPDLDIEPLPAAIIELREAVGSADALLIACPEDAHGIPGAFKNLLDWLVGSLEFPDKPVLLLNTAARDSNHAQDALMQTLVTMSAQLLTAQPLKVALPGMGCSVAQVLENADRCAELQAALKVLAEAFPIC